MKISIVLIAYFAMSYVIKIDMEKEAKANQCVAEYIKKGYERRNIIKKGSECYLREYHEN